MLMRCRWCWLMWWCCCCFCCVACPVSTGWVASTRLMQCKWKKNNKTIETQWNMRVYTHTHTIVLARALTHTYTSTATGIHITSRWRHRGFYRASSCARHTAYGLLRFNRQSSFWPHTHKTQPAPSKRVVHWSLFGDLCAEWARICEFKATKSAICASAWSFPSSKTATSGMNRALRTNHHV